MVDALNGAFTIMPIIIAIYYAGELVWRDRERRMHEIVDATAAPDWAFMAPKILAITLVLLATYLVAALAAAAVPAAATATPRSSSRPTCCGSCCPARWPRCCWRCSRVFVQVLVPQKFIGWAVMLL